MPTSLHDHKSFLTSLTADQRIRLTEKNNRPAIRRLLILGACILSLVFAILQQIPFWALLTLPLGILLISLFTLMHEATHNTAFASPDMNRWVCFICGLLLFLPPAWFRYFHLAHHRHTQNLDKDPELQRAKPANWPQFLIYISGIPVWLSTVRALTVNALGNSRDSFVPATALPSLRREARLMMAIYLTALLLSLTFQSLVLIKVWILPILLGQPFLRLYLLAEHGGCALTPNMFENTRTTYTTRIIRFICWNMPYHTEHHVFPMVPFHQLPALHSLVKQQLYNTENGYCQFTRHYAGSLR